MRTDRLWPFWAVPLVGHFCPNGRAPLSQTPAGAPRVSRVSRGPCPRGVLAARHTPSVDLLGPAMAMLSQLPSETPLDIPGLVVNRDFDSVETEDARA